MQRELEVIEQSDRRQQIGADGAVQRSADDGRALAHHDRVVRKVQEQAQPEAEMKRHDRAFDEHAAGGTRGRGQTLAIEPADLRARNRRWRGERRDHPQRQDHPSVSSHGRTIV